MTTRFRCGPLLLLSALAAGSACRSHPAPERSFAEAEARRSRYQKSASLEAIELYRNAQDEWLRRGDSGRAARAGQRVGASYEQLGALRESLQAYRQALALSTGSTDRLLESELRSDVGLVQSLAADREEDLDEALSHCRAALEIARQQGGSREEANSLNCLGEVHYHRGDLLRALELYGEAEPIWDRLGDARGQAETRLFRGWAYSELSRFEQAEECIGRARTLWASLGDKRGEAITMLAEARLSQRQGAYQVALNRFEEALGLLRPMGDAAWEGAALTGEGTVFLNMGQTATALRAWEESLGLLERAGLKNDSADLLLSLGATYLATGDDTSALERSERALALSRELGNRRWEAYALRYVGDVYLFRRIPTTAIQYFERSLVAQRSLGSEDPRLEAQTRADIGDSHELLGDHAAAETHFRHALRLARIGGDRVGEARGLFGLGRAAVGLGDLDAARRQIERAVRVAESLRTEVESRDLRASYFASVYGYHELHVEVLMRLNRARLREGLAAAAFDANEQARARALLESLADAGVDLRRGVDPDLLKREQMLRRAFEDWGARRGRLADAGKGDVALAEEYRDLEHRYDQVQAEIRSRSPRYAALTRPQPLGMRGVQHQVLDPDTVLLEYALGEERSWVWAVSKTGYESAELPPRARIEEQARRVRDRLTARLVATGPPSDRRRAVEEADHAYGKEAADLSAMILGPVAGQLRGKRLLVVADGALQYLPFAALPEPGEPAVPLAVRHEVVGLPSASVLAVLRNETRGRSEAPGAVAVLADPVFEHDDPRLGSGSGSSAVRTPAAPVRKEFPRLVASRHEAAGIVAEAPPAATLLAIGFRASRATATGRDLARYRIVHFATHGVFDDEHPERSGIVLSMYDEAGRPRDGFLRLHDVYELELPVDLVVMSACDTALGREVRGEGLVGMVRGFMYAGARRVVASLWKVDDEATGELMRAFYAGMLQEGETPAEALRQAQLGLWHSRRWQAPYYWAAFVLQGEPD